MNLVYQFYFFMYLIHNLTIAIITIIAIKYMKILIMPVVENDKRILIFISFNLLFKSN